MGVEPTRRVSSLYIAALALPENARATFLRDACPDDDERAEIESLLRYEGQAGRFLESGAFAAAIGRQIGGYEVLSLIGAGGMGMVYRARDMRLGRDVALKVLPPHLTADDARVARFAREARLLAALNHPNIGGIYGIEDAAGAPVLVLELVDGDTLAARLLHGPLAIADALDIGRQVAQALDAAHRKGIIHRDLKPANVGITSGGIVKVLDFGLAKAFPEEMPALSSLTLTDSEGGVRVRFGTPTYMSPEQARGGNVDRQSDIWSFGCLLYEMLAGKRAFSGVNVVDILAAIVTEDPDWDALPRSVPRDVRGLVERCLDKRPEHRPEIFDVIAVLGGHPARSPAAHTSDAGTTPRRILGLPLWLLVPLVLLTIEGVGFVTSWAFNRTIGLSARFGWEPPSAWFLVGIQNIIPVLVLTAPIVIVVLIVRGLRSALSSRFEHMARIDEKVRGAFRVLAVKTGLQDPYVLAPAVAIAGACALVIILWAFADLVHAFLSPINDLLPEQQTMLQPGRSARINYMNSIYLLMVFLSIGLWWVFRARRREGINGHTAWPRVGVLVLVMTVLCLVVPYRLLFQARFETIRFQDKPCFVLGENRIELLVHCPTIGPPRNLIVDRNHPALKARSAQKVSIFQTRPD